MSLSTIVRVECPTCGKHAVESSRFVLGDTTMITLACGHLMSKASAVDKTGDTYESLVFSDGARPRPYQIDAIKFAEAAEFKCIIADEQGLGKTIEALCLLRLHPERLLPCVIISPTNVKIQWLHEILRICCPDNSFEQKKQFLTQVIKSKKEQAMPGFQIYVVTFDMLKDEKMFELVKGSIKTIIIDECHKIKDHLSERAKAVQKLAKTVDYIIPMSGTPIKNHSGEYFTVLNLVDPVRFPNYQKFLRDYCDYYDTFYSTKVGGLKNPAEFREDTQDIVIRRVKSEVLKDLLEKERKFYHVELDPRLNKAYAKALKELDDLMYEDEMSEFEKGSARIAIMSKMRHITGVSKVEECCLFVEEFVVSCERKIVVFCHHVDVLDILKSKLDDWLKSEGFEECLALKGGSTAESRERVKTEFKDNPNRRVLLAATLAAGEGINLQFCSDAVMLERQWNPPNEEQAEDRFHRFGQTNAVSITYMLAAGTIDEYFTEIVEKKRAIFAQTMDGKEIQWEQQDLMQELANLLVTKGREKWKF